MIKDCLGFPINVNVFVTAWCDKLCSEKAALMAGAPDDKAKDIGIQLLKRKDIKALIDERIEEKRIAADVSVNWIIKRLVEIIEFNPSDVLEVDSMGSISFKKDVKNGLKHFESIGSSVSEGLQGSSRSIALKRADKLKALDMLIKLMGYEQAAKANGEGSDRNIKTVQSRVLDALQRRTRRGLPKPTTET